MRVPESFVARGSKRAVVGVLAAILFGGCAGTHHEPPSSHAATVAPTTVHVVAAREVDEMLREEVVGTVRPRNVAALSPSVMGTVRQVKVSLGSHVRAGDVLVRLSAGEIDAKVNQARANFAQADLQRNRTRQLLANNAIATAEVDSAEAQFRLAEASLAEAQVMQGYTVIRAPIAGVVTTKQVDVGDLAVPGRPLLVLESPGAMRLEASVPETIASSLAVGDIVKVKVDALGREIEATVGELAPSADPASRTVLAKLDLPPLPELHSGMFGRLLVNTGHDHAVTIPKTAIVRRGQIETVLVVEGGTVRLRLVRTASAQGSESAEVLSGLSVGERVVSTNPERLVDGQSVRVAE